MFLAIIILVLFVAIYMGMPFWAKLIILALDAVIPDPIPIIDEVLLVAGAVAHMFRIFKGLKIIAWMRSHKAASLCIIIGIILLIAFVIVIEL